jgi:hypothetical protein
MSYSSTDFFSNKSSEQATISKPDEISNEPSNDTTYSSAYFSSYNPTVVATIE